MAAKRTRPPALTIEPEEPYYHQSRAFVELKSATLTRDDLVGIAKLVEQISLESSEEAMKEIREFLEAHKSYFQRDLREDELHTIRHELLQGYSLVGNHRTQEISGHDPRMFATQGPAPVEIDSIRMEFQSGASHEGPTWQEKPFLVAIMESACRFKRVIVEFQAAPEPDKPVVEVSVTSVDDTWTAGVAERFRQILQQLEDKHWLVHRDAFNFLAFLMSFVILVSGMRLILRAVLTVEFLNRQCWRDARNNSMFCVGHSVWGRWIDFPVCALALSAFGFESPQ